MKFFLFLPQMRLSIDRLVNAARTAEAAGFEGMAGMDHLVPPGAESQPMFEAMTTNTWIAAKTETLKVSSLVMCEAMRHPAVLAKQAVTLDHASGGRFELAMGWGSFPNDFEKFGITPAEPFARVRRMREAMQLLKALWAGETIDFAGEFFSFKGAAQAPLPLDRIPVLIGGSGPKTLALVRDFADWWNLDLRHLNKLENGELQDLRGKIGTARLSIQLMIALIHQEGDREAVGEMAKRRSMGLPVIVGTAPELVERLGSIGAMGFERVYTWFCDFAPDETLLTFGEQVIAKLD